MGASCFLHLCHWTARGGRGPRQPLPRAWNNRTTRSRCLRLSTHSWIFYCMRSLHGRREGSRGNSRRCVQAKSLIDNLCTPNDIGVQSIHTNCNVSEPRHTISSRIWLYTHLDLHSCEGVYRLCHIQCLSC